MAKSPSRTADAVNRSWHISRTPEEIALTELEYSLFRVFESFTRWQMECVATAGVPNLSGADAAILNVVRMRDRPKGISDIARLLNRDDIANLQRTCTQFAVMTKDIGLNFLRIFDCENRRAHIACD